MHAHSAANAYAHNAVVTASPEKLVVMLYDRALQQVEHGRAALAGDDSQAAEAGEAIGRAFAIIGELKNALSTEVELSDDLGRLYDFVLDQLAEGQQNRDTASLDNALRVLRPLKEGFDGVALRA